MHTWGKCFPNLNAEFSQTLLAFAFIEQKQTRKNPLLISLYEKCSITSALKYHYCSKNLMVNCVSVSSEKIWFCFICFLQWPLMLSLHVIMTFPPQQERDQKSKRSHGEFVCLGSCDLYVNTRSAHAKVQFAEMYVVCIVGLSHIGTLRRSPKWILNHGVSVEKKWTAHLENSVSSAR